MGRRKIEIQPITHERNRSVTFLKRKNGLFKKAYELGVLCSVDVAVIIFEDRPGHDLKLHQYSSSDIRDIVQRQIRHQGEKDLRGPADFSGPANGKFDDDGDGDDGNGEDDEEEEVPARSTKKRRGAKMNMASDLDPNDSEYTPSHRSGGNPLPQVPPPPPMHSGGRLDSANGGGGVGSLLPVSNDRVSSIRESHPRISKRPRSTLDSMDPGRRSPAGDMMGSRPASDLYLPDQPTRFTRQMRSAHGMAPPTQHPYHHADQMHHPSQNFNPTYTPMFPISTQTSPPPSFIPLHTDFVPPRGHPAHPGGPTSFGRDMGTQHGAPYGAAPRGRFNEPQYDPALYSNSIMRHQPGPPQFQSGMHREDHGDGFAAFLEADERSRNQGLTQGRTGTGGMEWPNHENPPSPPRGDAITGRNPGEIGDSNSSSGPPGPQDQSWFDFLSGADANANAGGPQPPGGRSPRQGTSWERGGGGGGPGTGTGGPSGPGVPPPRDDLGSIFGSAPGTAGATTTTTSGRSSRAGAAEGRTSRGGGSDAGATKSAGGKGTKTPEDVVMKPAAAEGDAKPGAGEMKKEGGGGKRTPDVKEGSAKDDA